VIEYNELEVGTQPRAVIAGVPALAVKVLAPALKLHEVELVGATASPYKPAVELPA